MGVYPTIHIKKLIKLEPSSLDATEAPFPDEICQAVTQSRFKSASVPGIADPSPTKYTYVWTKVTLSHPSLAIK